MDSGAELDRVHQVAGRHTLLKVVVGCVGVLMGRRFIQRKLSHVRSQVGSDGTEVGHRWQVVASAIEVRIGEAAYKLAHEWGRAVVIGGRVCVLSLVLVAELTSEFE